MKKIDRRRQAGWRKSTFSTGGNGNCVEVNATPGPVGVRDTKQRAAGTLTFDRRSWSALLADVKSGTIG